MSSGISSRGNLCMLPRTRVAASGLGRTSLVNGRPQRQRCAQLRRHATEPGKDSSSGGVANVPLREQKPKIWLAFLAANLSVYAAGIIIALTVSNEASNEFFLALAKINSEVVAGEYWRLVTATFMHAGLLHLGTNCGSLWAVAPEVEAVYGKTYFAAIFLLTGVAGNVASFMLDDLVTVGASGGIFGLLGALAAYFLRNRRLAQAAPQLLLISGLLGLNVLLGLDEGSMVDNTGHVAGFVSGLWLGWNTCPLWEVCCAVLGPQEPLPSQRHRPATLLTHLQFVPKTAPPKKPFDWGSPMAPGPATAAAPPPLPPADAAGTPANAPATPSEPASPTIALLDTLLEIPPAAPERAADPAPAQYRATDPGSADASTTTAGDGTSTDSSTGGAGSREGTRGEEQRPAAAAAVAKDGGATGSGGTGAEAVDVSRSATAQSSLISFAVSLVVLAWAGSVGSTGGPPPL